MVYIKDTIAARATASGKGGIGIVRVSGLGTGKIARSLTGELPRPRYATYTSFRDVDGSVIDTGLALYFPAPGSFTGEDVLEIHGHGGPVVIELILNRIVSLGARLARPGEFTERAYLNDKIDLAQAEAIADLIESQTSEAARGAMRSLQGEFSRRINASVKKMIELRMYVEATMDFPEEEIDFISDDRISIQLSEIVSDVECIIAEAGNGALLTEGASVVLLGRPNAGKSSLMNQLTGMDTSIVTDVPGTTRDIVNENLQIDGIPLRLVDTAGLRESNDVIEVEGVRRARAASENADLVILVVDVSDDAPEEQLSLLDDSSDSHSIVVLNKVDLREPTGIDGVPVSAKTGEGMDELKSVLKQRLGFEQGLEMGFTARTRHVDALNQCLSALRAGQSVLSESQAGELLAEELKLAQEAMSTITGEFTSDDLLGEIFSRFCIGK